MSTDMIEVIESDDTQNVSEVQVKTVGDYLRQIDITAGELISDYERRQDSLMAQAVRTVADELRVHAQQVCHQGGWKDRQRLEKSIDKIAHSATQQKKILRQSRGESKAS